MLQNLANLYYDPRPPVFVNTNTAGAAEILDFRFYLDLNRNRRFETNGLYPIIDDAGRNLTNGMNFIGDPEWVGVLEHPEFVHSRTNRFVGRYAYIILPIGKSLDVNFIHNQGKQLTPPDPIQDNGYFRNQGVGSWEINLAAFLADLNTNVWNNSPGDLYLYRTNLPGQTPPLLSEGVAFRNATEIYRTRLAAYQNLAPASQLLLGAIDFESDMIDQYADGHNITTGLDNDLSSRPWPGAYNWTNFFTHQDFFDVSLPPNDFRTRLHNIGLAISSYDRYSYYRMLGQLSSDSAPELPRANIQQLHRKVGATQLQDFVAEPAGKININYDNLDYPSTDMVLWDATKFFTNVANVLLSSVNLSVTNIPIYPTNYYGVTVHRMLQLAANIYDSTTSNRFPSVFRPIISTNTVGSQVHYYISGYYYDDNELNVQAWLPGSHGVPMVIGAKKGLPNFNEYVAETAVMAARKLEFRRPDTNSAPTQTNEMYIIGVSNIFGFEAWNSYTNAFTGDLRVRMAHNSTLRLTNAAGLNITHTNVISVMTNFNTWPGFARPDFPDSQRSKASFLVPMNGSTIVLSNSVFRFAPDRLDDISGTNYFGPVGVAGDFRIPDWQLSISNDLVYIFSISNRIVDFVHYANLTNHVDITRELMGGNRTTFAELEAAECWTTNRRGGPLAFAEPTSGIQQQIAISMGMIGDQNIWTDFSFDVKTKGLAAENFRRFMVPSYSQGANSTNLVQQAPFTPARKFVFAATWEANDPLIHYLVEHMKGVTNNYRREFLRPFVSEVSSNQSVGRINGRYEPWRGNPNQSPLPEFVDHRIKDAGITKSDDWDFPTNKFPSIGWLGRVHRGTPWQTVYLKALAADATRWARYSLDPLSHPTNDWRLVDVFSVAVHPNASHGQLSINQTNFAAWSAVLSGITTRSNMMPQTIPSGPIPESYETLVIEPGSPQLLFIYDGIQKIRDQYQDKTFRRLGDILAVPQLSQVSPFLETNNVNVPYPDYGISDTTMEWIPQQILSLLKVGDPRYVVYAYGQSLRPADNSILTSGPFMGMCTNYQVTGEFVTRTVFQIEGTAGKPQPVVKSFNILSAE
jgi:hypothetical protein